MKTFYCLIVVFFMATSALATVNVSSPGNGATLGSPVAFVATATTSTCSQGVASMGIYVDGQLVYVVNGASMNTTWPLAAGSYSTVVEEWDRCGGASYTTLGITVAGQTGVWVTSPTNDGQVVSPVSYVASATTPTGTRGVAPPGIYEEGPLTYVA